MPKSKDGRPQASRSALQAAIDASDVIGVWDWNIRTDRVEADALIALLFNVDPDQAAAGAPLAVYTAGIHPEDRERITALIAQCVRDGGVFIAEYRVCSADGVIRWILARGQFTHDPSGRPLRGRGICIDITASRISEEPYVADVLPPMGNSLEQAGEHILAARKALGGDEAEPKLRLLADMLLLEVGHELARAERHVRLKRMN